jgi:protein-tyrosine-phosphatase
MAEAVFRHHASSSPLSFSPIDSAGTGGYHLLSPPDSRTISTLRGHSIPCEHAARQVHDADFTTFDYILAMDDENLDVLLAMRARVVKKRLLAIIVRMARRVRRLEAGRWCPIHITVLGEGLRACISSSRGSRVGF